MGWYDSESDGKLIGSYSGESDITVTDIVKELNHIKKALTEILVK